jgi:hypothetical protein
MNVMASNFSLAAIVDLSFRQTIGLIFTLASHSVIAEIDIGKSRS